MKSKSDFPHKRKFGIQSINRVFWKFIKDMLVSDIAIDLGTANTLVHVKNVGIVINEPSVVAYSIKKGKKTIHAVGQEACYMLGRTPGYIQAIRPMEAGVIADDEVAQKMIEYFIHKTKKQRRATPIGSLRIGICTPSGATAVNKKAITESALFAGGKKVFLIEESIAAAIGASLPVDKPQGSMVIDIGGGTTEIAVISLGGCVESASIIIGGDQFDKDIVDAVRREMGLYIGDITAEKIKKEIGCASQIIPKEEERTYLVKGRDSASGIPREVILTSSFISKAIYSSIEKIVFSTKDIIEKTPPELVADIADHGITLTGGGALIPGLDEVIASETGVNVSVANNPLECVVRGCGIIMDNVDRWSSVFNIS